MKKPRSAERDNQIAAHELIEQLKVEAQETLPREGEFTSAEMCVLLGLEKLARARRESIIRHLVNSGKLIGRKPANIWFYRLK